MSSGGSKSGPPTLLTALRQKRVSVTTGKFTTQEGAIFSLPEAVSKGLLNVKPFGGDGQDQQPPEGISLSDAIKRGLVEARSGKIMDQYSGKSIKISEAISRGIINQDWLEIYDGKKKEKISLKEALSKNIIDENTGKYSTEKGEKLQLTEALKRNLICNPMTLKECDDNELIDKHNKLQDPIGNHPNMNILEAISFGLLDTDLKSIRDVKANEYVSLGEALGNSIIAMNGEFKDSKTGEAMSLSEAVKRGHLTTVSRKSIFDIEGIKDQSTGNYISFNVALESGIIDKVTGKLVEKKTKQKIGFSEAAERGLIQPQLLDMLKKAVGIKGDKKKELTLLEAVMEKRIDPNSGLLVDPNTTNTVPMDKALQMNLITPLGAAILKSLMNITVTTATVTQTVRRTIKVSSAEFDEGAITFQEALRRGLIDDSTGIFTHPETGKELPLDEAITLGLLKLSPASSVKSSPMNQPESRASRQSPSKGRFSPERSYDSARPESPDKSRASPKRTIKTGTSVRKDSQVESLQTSFEGTQTSVTETSSQKKVTHRSSISHTTEAQSDSQGRTIPIVFEETPFKGRGKLSNTKPTSPVGQEGSIAGLTLRDAITRDFFDPVSGMFTNQDTDQVITFKESILSGLIDSESASVTSPDSSRASLNLRVAMERNFLDETAHYIEGKKVITLQQAIKSGKVRHVAIKNATGASGKRSSIQVESISSSTFTSESSQSDTMVIAKNIRYNTSTKSFEVAKDITAADLLQALKEGKIRPTDIQVQNSKGQGNVNILEALQTGLVNRSTGEYLTRAGKKMNIVEAIQSGFIAIVGAPGVSRQPPESIAIQNVTPKGNTPAAPQKSSATPKAVNGTSPKTSTTTAPRRTSTQRPASRDNQKEPRKDKSPTKAPPTTPSDGIGGLHYLRGGTIHARVIQSGVTTTKISSFMVEVPSTGEEITLEEAVKRGLVSEETAALYKQEVTTDSSVESTIVLITDPDTGVEMPSEEAIAKGVVTREEVEELLRMKDEKDSRSPKAKPLAKGKGSHLATSTSTLGRVSKKGSSSSSSSSSAASSDDENDKSSSSYRSELTIEIDKNALTSPFNSPMGHEDFQSVRKVESASHSIRTNIVNLKTGYALSNIDEVRNLVTGETMSLYEAKLRGIATDVKSSKADLVTNQLKMFVSEAVSKGLINFANATFNNPSTGQFINLSEAIKMGLLITDFKKVLTEVTIDIDAPTLSLGDAIQHCFDVEKKTFYRRMTKQFFTLEQAVSEQWINGKDIIFDVSSSQQRTVSEAMKEGILNGKTLDYKVQSTNTTHFLLDAANMGLVAVFPEPLVELEQSDVTYSLKETLENGVYHKETSMFIEISTQQHITIIQALKIGLIDFRSAEIQNTENGESYNLLEAIGNSLLDAKTSKVKDLKNKKEYTLHEAYEKGLIIDRIVAPFESISLWEAIEREQLDTETGMFFSIHEEKKTMTLEEAIYRKYIEKKSAFVKDTWKRKYCSLSEATRKKIIKDGRVMNTTTGKYLILRDAIDQQIIVRDIRSISLIDALDFGMYQPHSGKVHVPGLDREITLGEMIELKLIDHTKTIVKSRRSNRYVSTRDALREGDIDPNTGMYGNMNLLEARSKGYLLSTDAMQAVQEKFRHASESLDELNRWLEMVEREITKQENIGEDITTLKKQISLMKKIKQDLDDHSRPVHNTLDIISELLDTGSNVVSGAELNQLQTDGKRLNERYDFVVSASNKVNKFLASAYEELKKFCTELTAFQTWIDDAFLELEAKESQLTNLSNLLGNTDGIKEFLSEVMTHGADLKFLTISGQKFIDISKEYFSTLNEFCFKLNTSTLKSTDSQVSSKVTKISARYHELVTRTNTLSDKFLWVGSRSKDYKEAMDLARRWLDVTEPKVSQMGKEPIAAEPKMVDEQLFKAKSLNNEIIANGKLFHDLEQTAANLISSLDESEMSQKERQEIEQTCIELQNRYKIVADSIANLCTELDTALIQSQGVLDAIDSLNNWLEKVDGQFDQLKKPASLIPDRLDEQIRQLKLLQADIESHEPSIDKMFYAAQEFVKSGKKPQEAKKIEGKVAEIKSKYQAIVTSVSNHSHFLLDVSTQLTEFIQTVESFDEWYIQVLDKLEKKDMLNMDADEAQAQIDEISQLRERKKPEFDAMIKNGKHLVDRQNVNDVNQCKDILAELQEKWKELTEMVGEQQDQNHARKQSLNIYETLKEQISSWILRMEQKLDSLGIIALDLDILKQQADEIKPMMQEHKEYNKTIEKFKEISFQFDALLQQSSDHGLSSRRQSVNPRKPSMTPAGLRSHRPSIQTASSRRESSMPAFGEQSPIQKHLNDVTAKYNQIGTRLEDRNKGLKHMKEEIKVHLDNLKQILSFLQKQEKNLPKDISTTDKKELEKQVKVIKGILNQLHDNQFLLDETKVGIRDVVKKNNDAPGAHELDNKLSDVLLAWKTFQDQCKSKIDVLDSLRDFFETFDSLNTWLISKERMINVLGPISPDLRLIQNQLSQTAVIREDFNEKIPQKERFFDLAHTLLESFSSTNTEKHVDTKLKTIKTKWDELLKQLDEKERFLNDLSGPTKEFSEQSFKLLHNLGKIGEELDDILTSKTDAAQKLKSLDGISQNLTSLRPLWAQVESVGNQLISLLVDTISKQEIKTKLSQIEGLFNSSQKKLDNAMAELENNEKECKDFAADCQSILASLQKLESLLAEKKFVSANMEVLKQQISEFEPIYHNDIMAKEHEIIILLNKGKEIIKLSPKADAQKHQKILDNIEKVWQKHKKTAQDYQKRLSMAMEHCKKFNTSYDKFMSWLDKAETQLSSFSPILFVKGDLMKQEKDIQSFRYDVNRHISDYEGSKSMGVTLIDACDIDKECIKEKLTTMKERWDQLNTIIHETALAMAKILSQLGDFYDNVRDVSNNVNRLEDKILKNEKALKDPSSLETLLGYMEETRHLEDVFGTIQKQAENLLVDAHHHRSDASTIQTTVISLRGRIDSLNSKLQSMTDHLKNAKLAFEEFNSKVKTLGDNLSLLDDELSHMMPIGRDFETLQKQNIEVTEFIDKVSIQHEQLDHLFTEANHLKSQSATKDYERSLKSLKKQVEKLSLKSKSRKTEVETMTSSLQTFYEQLEHVIVSIKQVLEEEQQFGSVGSDVHQIKTQQEKFQLFQKKVFETVGKKVEKSNHTGQGLIQSASAGVNTSILEKDLERMNDAWNTFKKAAADRDKRLDQGLIKLGKFKDALSSLLAWFSEMDDMILSQKPPSSDYKVVKAQVQEQKFVLKLLTDRKLSIESLVKIGKDIAAQADDAEKASIENEIEQALKHFEDLNLQSKDRMVLLEKALPLAKDYHDQLMPFEKWLLDTENVLKNLENVPTDESLIKKSLEKHEKVHKDIVSKQKTFESLENVVLSLIQIVGDDDAKYLDDQIKELSIRLQALLSKSDSVHNLLENSMANLRNLVFAYEELLDWMEKTESSLSKFKILSVFTENLLEQMETLRTITEDIVAHQKNVEQVSLIGNDLMKNINNKEALQLKEKIDSLQRKYNDLASKAAELFKNAQEMMPLVQNFHQSHNRLYEWLTSVEEVFQSFETLSFDEQETEIKRLESDVVEHKPLLENINICGPKLSQISPGEGSKTIDELVTRDNRRFDAICDQIQRRSEKIQQSKKRSLEVISDINGLLDWFREIENQLKEAEPPSSEPDIIRAQLKEHKILNDEVSSQKGRVKDVLSNARKILRESAQTNESEQVKEKMDDLKETTEVVVRLSSDRLSILEQALPLSEHFYETHNDFSQWLDAIEQESMNQLLPGMRADLIAKQQETNRSLLQSVQDHKSVLDRLNKTGGSLLGLISGDDSYRIQEIIENDNQRYNALKSGLREMQQALEEAMQECSQFTDQLDGLLNALTNASNQVKNAEPISAHPEKIKEQIDDNNSIIDDLEKKKVAYEAVKKSAEEVFEKAINKDDVALKDIKHKLDQLKNMWAQIETATSNRSTSLKHALTLAEKFWTALQQVMTSLKNIEDTILSQDPPAVDPKALEEQKKDLKNIMKEIEKTKPDVDSCLETGKELISVVGEPEKPELKQHLDELRYAWENVTALYAKRENNLLDAMEKAMEFHENWQNLLDFLDNYEKKFANLKIISADINTIKEQIDELKVFKNEVDPWMVNIEALNRQAQNLIENATQQQAHGIRQPLSDINFRWEELNKKINQRQKNLEQALLRLGQFQHALNELLIWIECTDKTLNSLQPVIGDPQVIEVELAKLKVMVNDIQAHQSSVDTLNDAGRQILETEMGSDEASQIQHKLNELNNNWNGLLGKAEMRQVELENILKEAQSFFTEIQDMMMWLNDIDAACSASKPVGGLPETAQDQLDQFMELYAELEETGPKIDALLGRGDEYVKRAKEGSATNLQNSLRTLKTRWDNILIRMNDKKIKLEIALKEATEFHESIQDFMDWLSKTEKTLTTIAPVSRVLQTVEKQIDEHKAFQNEITFQRETMVALEKKASNLKHFSQKQDVILIKNLLSSVQTRWEKILSKSAERTRALDLGHKEAKEFYESWDSLCKWLDNASVQLQDIGIQNKNDLVKIKKSIQEHKMFQKELHDKQPVYDSTLKSGKHLSEKAPKPEEPIIQSMITDLKNKWLNVSNLSLEKERKLEEALLVSGQFKDALRALMDWLGKISANLDDKTPVHGDLDTVMGLVEKHKNFEAELSSRTEQVESLRSTVKDLLATTDKEDAAKIKAQITELNNSWEKVWTLTNNKTKRLEQALKEAEELHKSVNMLLEWLSDAEMKLRFSGPLPEDEEEIKRQIDDHRKFMAELKVKEKDKDYTLKLANDILAKCHPDAVNVIKQWITIIQSRWDEVASWALQRNDKLEDHLKDLKNILALLDELMQWLVQNEENLDKLEQEPLPDDVEEIERLIVEHQEFMDNLSARQPEIDSVCKPMRPKSNAPASRRPSKVGKSSGRDSREESPDYDPTRRASRVSPGERTTPETRGAPRFPDRKGSQANAGHDNRSPRAKALWDKWRHVWMMAWERDRRLKDKLSYLQELEKVKNFNWDEWRKGFLKHHNNRKSRITDLFRKLDEDADGLLTRDEFIDGILKTKLPSSRLEMNAVADKFDNGNGTIDWRKFMAALRPDWQDRGPLTDAERIDDEINRQVALCNCRQKFKVMQVGEGKYRFGDSQKLRLVRILRSTVMVRVGGGWCALDEFLVKNDPCRAKGRTNVELREQFTLAAGVSQGMATFKPKMSISAASPDNSVSGGSSQRLSTTGPIIKIKEKSERSLPMSGPSSLTGSYVEQRRPSNLSASRGGSRPASRAGSNLSLNSEEYSNQGGSTSIRRSSSMRSGGGSSIGGSTTTSRTSGRRSELPPSGNFGASSAAEKRRISSPYTNGRTPSNSSADRMPMSGRTRTPVKGAAESGFSGTDTLRRTSKTTTSTSYGADGQRITETTTTSYGSPSQEHASRN